MILYFNPDCSKCHEAVDLLQQNSCEFSIRNYLTDPPSVNELKELITKLKCSPVDLVRKKEPLFEEKYRSKTLTDEQWLNVLSENPVLIERPILINHNMAIIGRPPQLVLNIV